ncbi:hypothetical protein [Streptomyces longisporoflavus]|uniref:Uncharacterized protein n=1 Tax=Streptomyces longisporoflavus TaxID=28044 RepID=A0ABW7QMH3_9ACTN
MARSPLDVNGGGDKEDDAKPGPARSSASERSATCVHGQYSRPDRKNIKTSAVQSR